MQVILDISKILQSAMLDIFSIFFDVKSSTINEWSSAAIERILSISVRYEVPKVEDDVINEIKRSCALEVSSDEKQEILKVLDEWTQSVALKISAVLIPHLTRMHNASEIAHAQQAIWKAYIHHDEVKMHAEMSLISVAFNQSYLDDACEYLFNQKARQKPKLLSKASKESSSGSQLLWANFFQKSFHEQVEQYYHLFFLVCPDSSNFNIHNGVFRYGKCCEIAVKALFLRFEPSLSTCCLTLVSRRILMRPLRF